MFSCVLVQNNEQPLVGSLLPCRRIRLAFFNKCWDQFKIWFVLLTFLHLFVPYHTSYYVSGRVVGYQKSNFIRFNKFYSHFDHFDKSNPFNNQSEQNKICWKYPDKNRKSYLLSAIVRYGLLKQIYLLIWLEILKWLSLTNKWSIIKTSIYYYT